MDNDPSQVLKATKSAFRHQCFNYRPSSVYFILFVLFFPFFFCFYLHICVLVRTSGHMIVTIWRCPRSTGKWGSEPNNACLYHLSWSEVLSCINCAIISQIKAVSDPEEPPTMVFSSIADLPAENRGKIRPCIAWAVSREREKNRKEFRRHVNVGSQIGSDWQSP